jgi:hypothetical protein
MPFVHMERWVTTLVDKDHDKWDDKAGTASRTLSQNGLQVLADVEITSLRSVRCDGSSFWLPLSSALKCVWLVENLRGPL